MTIQFKEWRGSWTGSWPTPRAPSPPPARPSTRWCWTTASVTSASHSINWIWLVYISSDLRSTCSTQRQLRQSWRVVHFHTHSLHFWHLQLCLSINTLSYIPMIRRFLFLLLATSWAGQPTTTLWNPMMSIDLNEQIVSQAADEQQMNYKVFSFILYQKISSFIVPGWPFNI